MQYYFAPLEGLTDSIYRQLHHAYFPGIHRYYTPFFSPTVHRSLTPREAKELPPADSLDYSVVPQLLTKNADDFLWMTQECESRGYQEVNLNLGCPSGTVTAKGKGSVMLQQPDALDAFFSDIFSKCATQISVKTRIGFESPEEFPKLIEIFNRYPICQLTVHPRVRKAFYNGSVDMKAFIYALHNSRCPVCYNGNLISREDITQLHAHMPEVESVMLGRGLIADPGMLTETGTKREILKEFHDHLLEEYLVQFGGSRNAMFRMKENWRYMLCKFENAEKLAKRLRKTTDIGQYRDIVKEIFETLPMRSSVLADW